jgi:large subunit ribosomal protein L21
MIGFSKTQPRAAVPGRRIETHSRSKSRSKCAGGVEQAMYAVIKTGGKQYRVATGETLRVESIGAEVGSVVTLTEVLAVGDGSNLRVGTPLVTGAAVTATVVAHGRHDKLRIFKMRRRKHFQKHGGHRQNFTELRIDAIN